MEKLDNIQLKVNEPVILHSSTHRLAVMQDADGNILTLVTFTAEPEKFVPVKIIGSTVSFEQPEF